MTRWKKSETIVFLTEYHSGDEFERMLKALHKVNNVIDEIDEVVRRPLNKFTIVRVCSKLGIRTEVRDAKLRKAVLNGEDLLFGKVYPELRWEPVNCKFYGEWLRRNVRAKQEFGVMDLESRLERYVKVQCLR
jgi:hypothetical protein